MIVKTIKRNKTEISPRKKSKMRRMHKIGTMVAFRSGPLNTVMFGWSLVNFTENDKFSMQEGIRCATERAIPLFAVQAENLPVKVQLEFAGFKDRCNRYFK